MQMLMQIFLFYSLSHFECDSHTVHMLTQWHLPPPLTSTVKLSLFMHAHSSPLSVVARLHCLRANHCHFINNGRTFSGQTSYIIKATVSICRYFLNFLILSIHKFCITNSWSLFSIWFSHYDTSHSFTGNSTCTEHFLLPVAALVVLHLPSSTSVL